MDIYKLEKNTDNQKKPLKLSSSGRLQIRSTYAQNSGELFLTLSSSLNPDGTGLNFSGSNGTITEKITVLK